MRSSSECPSGVDVSSSLRQVLETGELPQRYYLSPKACRGILVRAGRRGKELPAMLKAALEQRAAQMEPSSTEDPEEDSPSPTEEETQS